MLPQKVDALEYMQLENVAAGNDGSDLPYSDEYIREYVAGMATDPDIYPNTDWQDLILTENGFNHGHTLTLTSSSGTYQDTYFYRVSGPDGYSGQFLLP